MAFARVQVELVRDSLLPADRSINTFHFVTPGSVADAAADINTNLETFYNAIDGALSSMLTGTANLKYYDLEDPEPRAPVTTTGFTFSPGANALPSECAIAMSFQGPLNSGVNQARRRGRIFLGPCSQASGAVEENEFRPTGAFRSTIATAADALMSDTSLPGLIWAVFSPTTAGPPPWSAGELTNAFVTITNGWVDNAYDTIRSRGAAPSARTTWS